jgi:hypothetical protein
MRFQYDRHRRRLHIWNPPAEDVAAIRAEVQRRFDARDVSAIVFYNAPPTTIILRGRFLEILIFRNKKVERSDVLPFCRKVNDPMSCPSCLNCCSEQDDEH